MKKLAAFLLGLALLASAFFGAHRVAAEEETRHVRVRLSTGSARAVTLDMTGDYRCNGTTFTGGTVRLERSGNGVRVVHDTLGTLSDNAFVYLERRPAGEAEACFSIDNTRYGTCSYLGDLYACVDGSGALCLVNYVTMEHYLRGVLSGELNDTTPFEALKAQAVAARGYALSCLGAAGAYDLGDDPGDQVYKGYRPEDRAIAAAVREVDGRTLLLDGEPIKCYYCTGNGGQTLTPAMCWGAANASDAAYDLRFDPYDVAGSDDAVVLEFMPDAAGWPEAAAAFLLRQARRQDARVAEVLGMTALTGYHDAENHAGSARTPRTLAPQAWAVAQLAVRLEDGTETALPCGFAPEALLTEGVVACEGANVWFVYEQADGAAPFQLVFSRAVGHRVGMSHRGMLEMARQGFAYEEILAFYYPNATLSPGTAAAPAQATPAPTPTPTPYELRVVAPSAAASGGAQSVWDALLGWLL